MPTGGGAADLARPVGYEDWLADQPAHGPRLRGRSRRRVDAALHVGHELAVPKGVMLANRNVEFMLEQAAGGAFEITEGTVSLVAMPLFHIGGSGWALSGMCTGAGRRSVLRDMELVELLRLVAATNGSPTPSSSPPC